jgi:hemolysin III
MRRLDHSMIFVVIAGTYTPYALIALRGALAGALLIAVWAGAAAGVVLTLAWIDAPSGWSRCCTSCWGGSGPSRFRP